MSASHPCSTSLKNDPNYRRALQTFHIRFGSKVDINMAATNSSFRFTPFLLFEVDALIDPFKSREVHDALVSCICSSTDAAADLLTKFLRRRKEPHDRGPAAVNTYRSFTPTLATI